jgi:hypothetical protein
MIKMRTRRGRRARTTWTHSGPQCPVLQAEPTVTQNTDKHPQSSRLTGATDGPWELEMLLLKLVLKSETKSRQFRTLRRYNII